MLSITRHRPIQVTPGLRFGLDPKAFLFGYQGLRSSLRKVEINRELQQVNNWVHFVPKADMDSYTLDSYKLAFMADINDSSTWSLAGQYDGEEDFLYETRIRGREGYGFSSASRVSQNHKSKYIKNDWIKFPDPLSVTQEWVPSENKDGHEFNTYKPYRKPTDDPNPKLMRLKQGMRDRFQMHQVWEFMRPVRPNYKMLHTHGNNFPNPVKLYYFSGHLGNRGTAWDHQSYIDNQNNWKPLTQNEITAHKERAEIRLRNQTYFDKLRYHPRNGFKHFIYYVTDAQFQKAFIVNSIPYFIYESDRTKNDMVKRTRFMMFIFMIAMFQLVEYHQRGQFRPTNMPVVNKYGDDPDVYKHSDTATEDIYGRDQSRDFWSFNYWWQLATGAISLFWWTWHYEKQEVDRYKKLHSFSDADFREDFKVVTPHDWKQNFMNYQLGHKHDYEKYHFKDDDVE